MDPLQLVEPGLGDGQVKQHGIVWRSRSKGLIQCDCGFVLLLIDKFATDLGLNRDVADVGRARHSRDGQINALGREKFGCRKSRWSYAEMLLEMKGGKYQGTGRQAPWLGEPPALKRG